MKNVIKIRNSSALYRRGVLAFELAIISIVIVVGCITGFAMFRDAVAYDCRDAANVIQQLDTSYSAGPYGSYTSTTYTTTVTVKP